jgi:hypothetical protein
MNEQPDPARVFDLVERIRPILAGNHPAVQGAAMADLVAIWLAGHPAEFREQLLALHVDKVRALVPPNVAAMTRGIEHD